MNISYTKLEFQISRNIIKAILRKTLKDSIKGEENWGQFPILEMSNVEMRPLK